MADSQALLASLLLGQRRRADPLESQRKYGETQMTAGADVSPVYSPWQGIARALQGGLGGLVAGQADAEQKTQDAATVGSLTKAAQATTPQDIAKALEGLKGSNADTVIPVLGQIIQSRLDQAITQQKAGTGLAPYNIGSGQSPGGQGNGGTSITITPGQQSGGAPQSPYQGTLSTGESGNNPSIVNPKSGAAGLYQFLPSTWADVRAKNPDLNLPENPTQATPQQQGAAEERFRATNAAELQKSGIQPTPANLAMAHWIGAGGVKAISQASPDTPLALLLSPEAIKQNPGLRTTVGDFVGKMNQKYAGVQGEVAPASAPGGAAPQPQHAGQPQQAPQPQPQMAQAQPQGQPAPQQGSPAGGQLRQQAQRAMAMGDNVTALKFAQQATEEDAKWATEQGKIQLQGQEHDRQQNTATPNNEQALAASFADRMQNSAGLINKFGAAGTDLGAKVKDMVPLVGNLAQSPEYQQYQQARNDFINAQLRRESGAAIAASEYSNADKQYFPQPGDGPEVLAQKAKNRQLAVEGMVRGAGPAYRPSATVGAQPQPQQGGGGDLVSQAKDAIAKGAPRDKVIERLRAQGINADGL